MSADDCQYSSLIIYQRPAGLGCPAPAAKAVHGGPRTESPSPRRTRGMERAAPLAHARRRSLSPSMSASIRHVWCCCAAEHRATCAKVTDCAMARTSRDKLSRSHPNVLTIVIIPRGARIDTTRVMERRTSSSSPHRHRFPSRIRDLTYQSAMNGGQQRSRHGRFRSARATAQPGGTCGRKNPQNIVINSLAHKQLPDLLSAANMLTSPSNNPV